MTHWCKWICLLSLFVLPWWWIGCEEETTAPDESPTPVITGWELPAKMAFNSPRSERIVVIIEDAQGPENVPFVRATLLNGSVVIDTFSLWDDGSFNTIGANPPWADSISGDLVPGDGFFSRRITGQFVDQLTNVTFRFEATDLDGHAATPVEVTLEVRANSAPVLEDPELPDTLYSRFDSVTLSVRATDPDDLDSLVRVWLEVEGSGKEEIELAGPDVNNRWSITIDRSFAAGIIGDFSFNLYAEDTFQEIGGPVGQTVMVENNPPVISNLIAPDTMYLPTQAAGSDTASLFLNVDDDQTLLDIYSVYFTSVRNDTIPNPTVFYLFDDGSGEDQIAGDGIYSQGIVLFWNNPLGKYTFTFKAKDLVDQESTPIVHDMWVVPSPVSSLGGQRPSNSTNPILQTDRPCSPFQMERRLP